MSKLADVLSAVVREWEASDSYPHLCAADILDLPEMTSIREALFDLTHPLVWPSAEGPIPSHRSRLQEQALSPAVVDWVLELHGSDFDEDGAL